MRCKNDPQRNYNGKEPSPKGLGWCAHASPLGKRMKGKDMRMWVVKATNAGVKRWVHAKLENIKKRKGYSKKQLTAIKSILMQAKEPEYKAIRTLHNEIVESYLVYYVKKPDTRNVRKIVITKKTRQGRHNEARRHEKELEEDPDVVAVLSAAASNDWYEGLVAKMKRKKIPFTKNGALENWRVLWKKYDKKKKTYY